MLGRSNDNLGHEFDRLVHECQQGCAASVSSLVDHVHDDLYLIARRLCGGCVFENSLHATNLLNETFLRLLKSGVFRQLDSKDHLYATAATTMRSVIADYLRRRRAEKRPTSRPRCHLEDVVDQLSSQPFQFDELNRAIQKLEKKNARQGQVVNMRFFLGMSIAETAQALRVSESTVEKDWRKARVILFKELF